MNDCQHNDLEELKVVDEETLYQCKNEDCQEYFIHIEEK